MMYNYPAYYGHAQPFHYHHQQLQQRHYPPHSPYFQPHYSPYGAGDYRRPAIGYSPRELYNVAVGYNPLVQRDYPKVDTHILTHSLAISQSLLKDASLVTQKLQDPAIAGQLMTNAQRGNQKEVDRIVHSFGCAATVVTTYSPSSVKFTLNSQNCEITLSLKWGE